MSFLYSAAFGRHGQGIFLSGSQELQRFAVVGGTDHQLPPCFIPLPEGSRPAPPVADAPLQRPLEATTTLQQQQPATPLPTVGEAATTNGEEEQVIGPVAVAPHLPAYTGRWSSLQGLVCRLVMGFTELQAN